MSPGLRRARAPFFLRNTITGLVLAAFAGGVWAYSLSAVKQDDFVDVDEEARALARSGVHAAADPEHASKAEEHAQAAAPSGGVVPIPVEPGVQGIVPTTTNPVTSQASFPTATHPRGVLASLMHNRYPQVFDPITKTFIWGAPSVDNIGRLGEIPTLSRKC